jgi:hypothetical protein
VIVDFSSADKWTLFGVDVLKILRAWWGELSASVPARVKQLFVRQPARELRQRVVRIGPLCLECGENAAQNCTVSM